MPVLYNCLTLPLKKPRQLSVELCFRTIERIKRAQFDNERHSHVILE